MSYLKRSRCRGQHICCVRSDSNVGCWEAEIPLLCGAARTVPYTYVTDIQLMREIAETCISGSAKTIFYCENQYRLGEFEPKVAQGVLS